VNVVVVFVVVTVVDAGGKVLAVTGRACSELPSWCASTIEATPSKTKTPLESLKRLMRALSSHKGPP